MSRQGKKRPRTLRNVRQFWNNEARRWGDDPRVTIRDHFFRLLTIGTILPLIKGEKRVLDIGCGTGFSSLFYAEKVDKLIAADYAPLMIRKAKKFLSSPSYFRKTMRNFAFSEEPKLRKNLKFEVENIMGMKYPNNYFDKVITERVLINLPEVSYQTKAVSAINRVLKPGGKWILVEVTRQGHEKVDKIRRMFGLGILEKYWHNLYINEPRFEKILYKNQMLIKKKIYFETYQFLTKVVHPLVVAPKEPEFMNGFNNAAREVSLKLPTYQSVVKAGFPIFLKKIFRNLLSKYDPGKLPGFDRVVPLLIVKRPNFSRCSHQVLYVIQKD